MKTLKREIPGKFSDLLYTMDLMGASDAQLHPGRPVWYRRGGTHVFAEEGVGGVVHSVTHDDLTDWLSYTAGDPETEDPLGPHRQISRAVEVGDFRARATFRDSIQGTTASIRLVPRHPPTCDELGVADEIQALTKKTAGLVIVEGPTGSGKTTLLNALLDKINNESNRHIYTLEDPVEFVHQPVGETTIVNREVGYHVPTYAEGVKDALRSKPDVIYMGELRDPVTVKAALRAATTGHLVFTTAHAGDVTEAIQSTIGQFESGEQPQIRQQLAMSTLAIICQRLVRTTNPEAPLTAVQEVMINNVNFRETILDGTSENTLSAVLDSPSNPESWSMERSLAWLTLTGVITEEVALAECRNADRYFKQIKELKESDHTKKEVAQQQRSNKAQRPKAASATKRGAIPSRLNKRFG